MENKDIKEIRDIIHKEVERFCVAGDELMTNQECMRHLKVQRTTFAKLAEQLPCVYVGERCPKNRRFFKSKVNLYIQMQSRI